MNSSEEHMKVETAYQVKIGDLAKRLGIQPMDLVRKIGVSTNIAYTAMRNETITLDMCYRIYKGLREMGYDIRWEDVVEID